MRSFSVDAFTRRRFCGNPAAVVVTEDEITDELKQLLAAEFNLSETAFPKPLNGDFVTSDTFELRWFTPTNEVPLCGHATLATSHVLFHELGNLSNAINFETRSGRLTVTKDDNGQYLMDFPLFTVYSLDRDESEPQTPIGKLPSLESVGHSVASELVRSVEILDVAYATEAKKLIVAIAPTTTRKEFESIPLAPIKDLDPSGTFIRGVILTFAPVDSRAQGFDESVDYVLRYFSPWNGIAEDPATGSAQCAAAPFWSARLGKRQLKVYQAFPGRGADFEAEVVDGGRLKLRGSAVTIFKGQVCQP